ncbi:TIGR02391 family protein [Aquibium sp. A9E412]|uniref:TIGR02391 family protein n=1 Tax=Aquibium sp. A9E412 TaxID=2976767 RepID=UPI0025AEE7DE|nr:TIGR02391 family protein [Aquibium sp. A9E412]MDN2565372.1 TIGR02391 family protein [Aquibium sp. A9E412]
MTENFGKFEAFVRSAHLVSSQPSEVDEGKLHPFDERNIHPDISSVAIKLFDDGHYSQATFEAYKLLDNKVSELAGISETGYKLMMAAFNAESPKIRLNDLTTLSEKDEQRGFSHLFAGAATAIRNPRGHTVGNNESLDLCLDHLSLASFLLRRIYSRRAP